MGVVMLCKSPSCDVMMLRGSCDVVITVPVAIL